jgi:hypothetical protein
MRRQSLPFLSIEFRLPLFLKGQQPLTHTPGKEIIQEDFDFHGDNLLKINLHAPLHKLFHAGKALRALRNDPADQPIDFPIELTGRHRFEHQTAGRRFSPGEPPPRKKELLGLLQTDEPRQTLRASRPGDQAEIRMLVADDRLRRGQGKVAGLQKFAPAGKAVPVHRGDHGNAYILQTVEGPVVLQDEIPAGGPVVLDDPKILEIGPRTEALSLAPHNKRLDPPVHFDLPQGLLELLGCFVIQGVVYLRAIQCQRCHRALFAESGLFHLFPRQINS